jgi:hypothetical protein
LGGFAFSRVNRTHLQNASILDWVRIFDKDRPLLARKGAGKNSSLASLPSSYY